MRRSFLVYIIIKLFWWWMKDVHTHYDLNIIGLHLLHRVFLPTLLFQRSLPREPGQKSLMQFWSLHFKSKCRAEQSKNISTWARNMMKCCHENAGIKKIGQSIKSHGMIYHFHATNEVQLWSRLLLSFSLCVCICVFHCQHWKRSKSRHLLTLGISFIDTHIVVYSWANGVVT